jgi:cardiolipin synthase
MDYRSFYLHFENGVWICGSPVLQDIKNDLQQTFDVCEEISLDEWRRRPWHIKCVQSFLRLFAVFF